MATKAKYPGPAAALELYEALIAAHPDVERKGAKNPYTSLNGHMFSFLDETGQMALRLSDDDAARFLEQFESGPVEQYGATMRGYVSVPATLLADTTELEGWFGLSHSWIATLKPKPTKKPAKKRPAKKAT